MNAGQWTVYVKAESPVAIDRARVQETLEASDVGGDIIRFRFEAVAVSIIVVTTASTRRDAYNRVVARASDALGTLWSVGADRDAPPADRDDRLP